MSDLLRQAPAAPAQPAVPETLRLAIFRVDFLQNSVPDSVTGSGQFDLRPGPSGVLVDPPPHNKLYLETHAEALRRVYDVQSYGSLVIEPTLFPADSDGAYHLTDTADYGPWEISQNPDVIFLAETFVGDAINAVDQSGDVDFASFDAFVVVHAGADFQGDINRDSPYDIPSFTITLAESLDVNGGAAQVGRVLVLPETASQDGRLAALNGVFAHEFGHILDLPDLYNIFNGFPQVGFWSLMDSGENIRAIVEDPETGIEFEADGIFPTSFDPWSKLLAFGESVADSVIQESWSGALEGIQVSPFLPYVSIDALEYFLIENRALDLDGNGFPFVLQDSTTGVFMGPVDDPDNPGAGGRFEYDAVLPGGGVLIWHIDERFVVLGLDGGAINFDIGFRGVAVEEADGVWDQGRFNLGRPEDPFFLGTGSWECRSREIWPARDGRSWCGGTRMFPPISVPWRWPT
jgi:M6 family metalloprotease-like protein